MIPLFDSLAHPTLTGRWLKSSHDAGVELLVRDMSRSGFSAACAVGLAGVEGYEHQRFADMCRPYRQLFPVAGIDPLASDLPAQLDTVKDLGYVAIKLHPRFSSFSVYAEAFSTTLREARNRDLAIFLCTYFHGAAASYPDSDPLYGIARALKAVPDARLVLLHGGDVELMRYCQFARHSENVLVDLSFTMMKYRGSSLDLDMKYLAERFNRRVCIGTDHPEYGHAEVRSRFEELTAGVDDDEAANIGYRNLSRFLGVDLS